MEKYNFSLIFLLAIASISPSIAQTLISNGPTPIDKLSIPTLITTQIRFYMQAVEVGPNETSYQIANSSITHQSPTRFGFLNMFDNLLTEGPQPTSNATGRAQGLFGSADLYTLAFFVNFNVYFTSRPYNGSTLNIVGRYSPSLMLNEMSVAGGTQFFRLAKGIVTTRAVSEDRATLNADIQFNVTVFHYPLL